MQWRGKSIRIKLSTYFFYLIINNSIQFSMIVRWKYLFYPVAESIGVYDEICYIKNKKYKEE